MSVGDAGLARKIARAYLTDMPEAMFARAVILVEGVTDKGVLEGCGTREDPLNTNGIMVVKVEGKQNLRLPYAILTTLGIPTYAVFDGDRHNAERKAEDTDEKLAARIGKETRKNRDLLSLFGAAEEDWPETTVANGYAVFRDTLEDFLKSEWTDWETTKKQLIADGHGTEGKSEHTYYQATLQTETLPPARLKEIIARVQHMAKEN
ncbi:ATP-dependent endonuclease [Actinomadura violacea]|uniref:ATP-dependent endonuclease n=1 Tax=Actinomadura violacea TaxID=2819934 RepID=A0ABS3RKT1_9ACTN|nr:ATP-dependent endonuclease [Actinomadura violacea]MBO2457277.1 ATP-dependent endonuclease [Actinomadura violacea]